MKPVTLTRRVTFSSGHRYWFADASEEENRRTFGPLASPYNHGHNYVLYCSIQGNVDHTNGMVINIKDLDDILEDRIVSLFDQKSINDEVPEFGNQSPCLENLLNFMDLKLREIAPGVKVTHLKLEEMPGLYAELDKLENKMTITRSYEFAAAHRLHVPELSEAQNLELYGKCNNPAGHGHNYILEVSLSGSPDPRTGFIADLGELDRIVEERVVGRYDHKHLNCDVPELEGKNPTSEIVALAIWDQLEGIVPGVLEMVRLQETERNIFEVKRG
jgi:6-pyruvoyltetrahydropterin/6-carboxytetrahydropterin synthase